MLVGIPGSGKTTYGRTLKEELKCLMISSDEVRNLHPTWDEVLIFPEVYRLIAIELEQGHDVIFDATNVTPKVRARLKEKLEPYHVDYKVGCYYFPTPWKECYKRIEKRNTIEGERFFPLDAVEGYATTIVAPTKDEGFIFVKTIDMNKNES